MESPVGKPEIDARIKQRRALFLSLSCARESIPLKEGVKRIASGFEEREREREKEEKTFLSLNRPMRTLFKEYGIVLPRKSKNKGSALVSLSRLSSDASLFLSHLSRVSNRAAD